MTNPSTPGAGDREGGEPSASLRGAARLKERPILFSAPMVRAILDNRKGQTRRIVKPQPPSYSEHFRQWYGRPDTWLDQDGSDYSVRCPYGQPGDRLWVRETFLHIAHGEMSITDDYESWYGGEGCKIEYAADGATPRSLSRNSWMVKRPSIHMPRWASRLTLEVTGVRIERLQDITEADAQAEGAVFTDFGKDRWGNHHPGWTMEPPAADQVHCLGTARYAFANLINKINGPKTWDANPWVWVVEFKANSARSAPEASSPKGPLPATHEVTP